MLDRHYQVFVMELLNARDTLTSNASSSFSLSVTCSRYANIEHIMLLQEEEEEDSDVHLMICCCKKKKKITTLEGPPTIDRKRLSYLLLYVTTLKEITPIIK